MKVLSLFDGISTGRYCLEQNDIPIEKYYASEIDKFAIAISKFNYPDIEHLGDIRDWKKWSIDFQSIDLIIGGSPCTNLSSAGNKKGLDGKASGLFYYYLEIFNYIKSFNTNVKFLLENVNMSSKWEEEISKLLGVLPYKINSNICSAQNRLRLYWTNIKFDEIKEYNFKLKDILETNVDDEYFLLKPVVYNDNIEVYPARIVGRPLDENGVRKDNSGYKLVQCLETRHTNGKSHCLTTVRKDNYITNIVPGRCNYIYDKLKDESYFYDYNFIRNS